VALLVAVVGLVVVAVLAVVAVNVSAVRRELLGSFTRLPDEYTELYFTQVPTESDGTTVAVPISLVHHGARQRSYQVRVQLLDSAGRALVTRRWAPDAEPDMPVRTVLHLVSGNVSGIGAAATDLVQVTLADAAPSLHYRLSMGSP
jgi:hypothetical protein